MPGVAVVVPWRGGCPHRERAWAWVRARLATEHPDWEIIEAPGPEPWIKSLAVMPAVERCSAGIIVVHDADVISAGTTAAVEEVRAGAPWAQPHEIVHRLSEEGTAAVLAGADPAGQPLAERPHQGMQGGGIVVLPRVVIQSIPLDAAFVGWG